MLRTLKQAFRSDRPLDVKAFVVADRDYALDETLRAERELYANAPVVNEQTWHIWERTEIENYLLQPAAIARAVSGAVAETPLFSPPPDQIAALLDEIVETARERLRLRMIDVFSEKNRAERLGWQPSTITQRAEEFVAAIWQAEGRYAWCDAKEIVLPALRQRIRERYQVQLSGREIVEAVPDEEIPADLRQAVEALAAFVGEEE